MPPTRWVPCWFQPGHFDFWTAAPLTPWCGHTCKSLFQRCNAGSHRAPAVNHTYFCGRSADCTQSTRPAVPGRCRSRRRQAAPWWRLRPRPVFAASQISTPIWTRGKAYDGTSYVQPDGFAGRAEHRGSDERHRFHTSGRTDRYQRSGLCTCERAPISYSLPDGGQET